MKLKGLILVTLAFALALGTSSCYKCKETSTITICSATAGGPALQHFSIAYLDSAGNNYINGGGFNLANCKVYLGKDGLYGGFTQLTEDFSDGTFGPFNFTCPASATQFGVRYEYYYLIEKDTHGVDTLKLVFIPMTDECHTYWAQILYIMNGDTLATYTNKEIADIVVVE